ncbi:TPA: hypothetical protein PTV74_003320 [Clostridium botulinum]|nr:hypothetical protein [Clostridium botulinum]HDK7206475.1 hypothetical protein [Clostridium botulinum]HDK7210210.1 hypothetical protein [Clostridium botulinum]HDK7265660.1 hypothetical protein [Clostridium botulinum]HDK7269507.1 hypothetical protein [Clostridium botulinum]
MLRWVKRIIITGIIVIGTLANQGNIGITNAVSQCEDNSSKNGWYYYCDNNSIIDMNETYLNKKFIYFQPNGEKKIVKLIELN